jgi:hypothetical protein
LLPYQLPYQLSFCVGFDEDIFDLLATHDQWSFAGGYDYPGLVINHRPIYLNLLDNAAFTRERPHFGNLVALNLAINELIVQPWCYAE